jgi:primase-polymerase (primpol)-like protein
MTPRPIPLRIEPENIPDVLKRANRWVGWKYEWVNERWTKVPYHAHHVFRNAKSNDSRTWSPFETALAGYRHGRFDGIGICLGKGTHPTLCDCLAGIDCDHCVQPDGTIDPHVLDVISVSYRIQQLECERAEFVTQLEGAVEQSERFVNA